MNISTNKIPYCYEKENEYMLEKGTKCCKQCGFKLACEKKETERNEKEMNKK